MKYLIGIIVACIFAVALGLINKYIVNDCISDFLIGWICCTVYVASKNVYEELKL